MEADFQFGRDDLPLVAKVVDLVHTWTYEQSGRFSMPWEACTDGVYWVEQPNGG